MRLRLLLSILLSTVGISAMATHMSGGEIYWECIGPDQYRIKLVVFRDCAGIAVDPSYNLQLTSPCGNRTLSVVQTSGTEISQLCDMQLPNSTCNGGTLPGIQQYEYSGIITLPNCNSWTIRWTNIYRNAAIVNLMNPGSQEMFITAVMNTVAAPCNDSPIFTNAANPYVCLNHPFTFSYGAFDPEADSLSYSLISARRAGGNNIAYVAPNTPVQPIPGLTLDPLTGQINFTVTTSGNWVVVVQVTQYNAQGQVIGTIMRDMQFVAYPCDNIPPDASTGTIQNLTGTAVQTGPRAVEVCESGNFCFDFDIHDPNLNNTINAFSNIGQNLPGATFTVVPGNPLTGQVCWSATQNTAGFYPFIVSVNDGACPIYAIQTYVYSVRVLPGVYADLQVVEETCLGYENGSLTAVVTSGNAPYTYSWSNGSSGPSIQGAAGDHSVVIEDSNGCISHALNGSIGTAALPPTANGGGDQVVCLDQLPVQLHGTVNNSTTSEWSGGSGTFTGTGSTVQYMPAADEITAGAVQLTLTTTEVNGCPPAADVVTINFSNSLLSAELTSTDATCFEINNGSAAITPDSPHLNYLWNDPQGQTTATATDLAPGNYQVTVTDTAGCSIMLDAFIGPSEPLTIIDVEVVDETCLGAGDGSATVIVTGGTGPYIFEWNTGWNGQVLTTTSGSYFVGVSDANGCAPAFANATIGAAALHNVADAGNDMVVCMDDLVIQLTGTVTNASSGIWSGGTGTFTGTGVNVQYTPSADEIAANGVTLTLTTTGNDGCPADQDQVSISIPNSFLAAQIVVTDATCHELSNGQASVTSSTPGLTFLWNDPAQQTSATATGLAAGSYTVIVTDEHDCTIVLNAVVGPTSPVTITSVDIVDETCLNVGDGTATVNVSGGSAPYSYTWSTGATGASINAASGTYTVSVSDAGNCAPATAEVNIGAMAFPNEADAGDDMVICMDDLVVQLTGVSNTATGVWSGGTGTYTGTGLNVQYTPSEEEIAMNMVTLTLTTTGKDNCPADEDEVTIHIPNSFLNADVEVIDATCFELGNGSASVVPASPSFEYLWNDAAAQTTPTATGLGAGSYEVLVTDEHGCMIALTAVIGPNAPVSIAAVEVVDETCLNAGNGTATVTATGGNGPYTYSWSTGHDGTTMTAASGTYTITVTDANGCVPAVSEAVIGAAALPNEVSAGDDRIICMDAFPVQINGTVTNATGVIWSGGSELFQGDGPVVEYMPSQMDVDLGSVVLTITSTGNEACPPAYDEVTIYFPNSFVNGSVISTDASCNELSDGSATYAPASPAFTYLWKDPQAQAGNTATGLAAGTHELLVTDEHGCSATFSALIGPPAPVAIVALTHAEETCLGLGDGSATVVAEGGTAPYTYAWSNGGDQSTITATSGIHTIVVTDANGCIPATGEITIGAAALPNEADAGADHVVCMDALPLQLTGSVTNATSGTWSGGSGEFSGTGLDVLFMPSADDLALGSVTFTLTTMGNDNCPAVEDQVMVLLPDNFANGSIATVDASCHDVNDGSATFTPEVAGASYAWNDAMAQTNAVATGLGAGNYIVTATDEHGCSASFTAFVGPASPLVIAEINSINENCAGNGDGQASVTVSGGTAPYFYSWNNGGDQAAIQAPAGEYTVSVTDANNCTPISGTITIEVTDLPNHADAGGDIIACMDAYPVQLNGTVQNAGGGTWSGGNGAIDGAGTSAFYWPTIAEIMAGGVDLVLTSTGISNCPHVSDTVHIAFSNAFFNAGLEAVNTSCHGTLDGSLSFTPQTSSFSYAWGSPVASAGPEAAGLGAGLYSVTITDHLGCDSTFAGTITSPEELLIATLTSSNVTCHGGSTGQAAVAATGGTLPYSYSWSSGDTTSTVNGLLIGEFTVNVTDDHGCTADSTVTIGQPAPMTLLAQVPDTVCVNAPVLLTAQAAGGNGGYQYDWSGLGTGDSITVELPATQYVIITAVDSQGCTAQSQIHPVHVLDLTLADFSTYGNTTICPGEEVTVGAAVTGYAGTYTISWPQLSETGTGPFTFPLNASQQLQVVLENACNDTWSETITLHVDVPAAVALPPIIAQGCSPLTVQFPTLPLGNVTWTWDLGNGMISNAPAPLVVYQTGTYTASLTITTQGGCSASATSTGQILAHASPVASFNATPWSTTLENAVITFNNTSTGTITSTSWNFGDGATSGAINPHHQYNDIGSFEVDLFVQNAHGCTSTASQIVQITPTYEITLPNAFTPNGNGGNGGTYNPMDLSNDVFYAFVKDIEDFRMRIFNRWGELIFESDELRRGWDGYYRGELSPQDVYMVQTWVRFVDGREMQKLSDLTLLR